MSLYPITSSHYSIQCQLLIIILESYPSSRTVRRDRSQTGRNNEKRRKNATYCWTSDRSPSNSSNTSFLFVYFSSIWLVQPTRICLIWWSEVTCLRANFSGHSSSSTLTSLRLPVIVWYVLKLNVAT